MEDQGSRDLSIVARAVTDRHVNSDALLQVFQCAWVKKGGIELKALDRSTFRLYFKEAEDIELVLSKMP